MERRVQSLELQKTRIYMIILALSAAGSMVGFTTAYLSGVLSVFTASIFSWVLVFSAVTILAIYTGRLSVRMTEEILYFVIGGSLLMVLLYALYLAESVEQARPALVGFYLWGPIVYVLVFLIYERRGAVMRSAAFFAVTVTISLPALLSTSTRIGISPAGEMIEQLHISSGITIALLFFFSILKERLYRTEAEVDEQKDLYETMLRAQSDAGEGFVILQDTYVHFSNEAFSKISGYSPRKLTGTNFLDLISPDQRRRFFKLLEQRLNGEKQENLYEFSMLKADGRRVNLEVSVERLALEAGDRLIVIARDTTRRKLAEREMQKSEERFRTTFEAAPVGISHLDTGGNWIMVNRRLCEMFGYEREEMLRMSFRDITDSEYLGTDYENGARLLNGTLDSYSTEKRYRHRDGRGIWGQLTVSAVRDDRGRVQYLVSVIEDITERRKTEEAVQEMRQSERTRIARELHDSALQDISYAAQELQLAKFSSDRNDRAHQSVERGTDALQRATRHLREAIYDLRQEEIQERSFVESVRSLVELNRQMSPDREIDFHVGGDFPEVTRPVVRVDLLRTLQECLTNARRHSGADNIRVSLECAAEEVRISVADDGQGFEPETAVGGLGITGMMERARALGAELEIESLPTEGARVTITIARSVVTNTTPDPTEA